MPGSVLLISMPRWNVDYPFHAVSYVAGLFRDAGWKCRVADLNIQLFRSAGPEGGTDWDLGRKNWHHRRSARKLIAKYLPAARRVLSDLNEGESFDLVAFTSTSQSRYFTLEASEFIRSLAPETPILFGGADCFPSEYHKRYFDEPGAPDIMCNGEAEIALRKYLEEFDVTGGYETTAKGYTYKGVKGLINTGQPDLPDLERDTVRPDWSVVDFSLYQRPGDFTVFTSRGCPNRCTFCNSSLNYRRYRTRKPSEVFREIQETVDLVSCYNPRPTVHFAELLINGRMDNLEHLCHLLIESGVPIDWEAWAWFRPEMSRSFLGTLARSGCKALTWGFESASQRVLGLMRKNYDHEVARRILRDASKAGIENQLPLIVGYPGETVSDFVKTLFFVFEFENCATFAGPSLLVVDNNSLLHKNYKQFGLQNNAWDTWVSADSKNDLQVRLFRQFVLKNALHNKTLALHAAVDWEHVRSLDFDRLSLASEVAGLLYELWKHSGRERTMIDTLTRWPEKTSDGHSCTEEELQQWHPENVPREVSLRDWFAHIKDVDDTKTRIGILVLEALREVRDKIRRTDDDVVEGRWESSVERCSYGSR